jgi:predicted nuclease of predicted toxin-antitoxin system
MRFVVDAQLPPQLADWLRSKGHDASHALAVLGEGQSDASIVSYASEGVIVSKDGDFLGLLEGKPDAPRLLWIRCGNTRNSALFALLEANWTRVESELLAGAPVVEVG